MSKPNEMDCRKCPMWDNATDECWSGFEDLADCPYIKKGKFDKKIYDENSK